MMASGLKSQMSWTCFSVCPLTWDNCAAERLSATMRAGSSGEKAGAIGDVNLHPRSTSGGVDAVGDP